MISPWLADLIVAVVTLVWVAAFVVSLVLPHYRVDPQIHVIFGAVAGTGMTLRRKKSPESTDGATP
jgi:uncharacterized membrane-anchored protein